MSVWLNKANDSSRTIKTFKVEKVCKNDPEGKSTNLFDEIELLQLKSAIDKAIMEENVSTILKKGE